MTYNEKVAYVSFLLPEVNADCSNKSRVFFQAEMGRRYS